MSLPFVSRSRFDELAIDRQKFEEKSVSLGDQVANLRESLARCQAFLESSNRECLEAKLAHGEIKKELEKERLYIAECEAQIDEFEKAAKGVPTGSQAVIPISDKLTIKGITDWASKEARNRQATGGESLAIEVSETLKSAMEKGRKDAKVG